eukprot:scaffold24602_cov33-Phaeocystis_antarctica.AAC.1
MSKLVTEVSKIEFKPKQKYITFEICCNDMNAAADDADEDVEVPYVSCGTQRPGVACKAVGPATGARKAVLCSILHGKDHKAPRAAPLVFSSCTLRDFARTHRAHAVAGCCWRR